VAQAELIRADARNPGAAGLQAGSVDCIVTSPPYWNLKKYGDEVDGEIGHGQGLDEYLRDMETVFRQCLLLVRDTGVMWLIVDTLRCPPRHDHEFEMVPLPTMLAELAQSVGWRFHDQVIWRKKKTLPYSGERKLRNLVEYIVLLTKSRTFKHRPHRLAERHQPNAEWLAGWPERYHPLGKNPSNIWDVKIPTQGIW
jgi:DNA modification methylase